MKGENIRSGLRYYLWRSSNNAWPRLNNAQYFFFFTNVTRGALYLINLMSLKNSSIHFIMQKVAYFPYALSDFWSKMNQTTSGCCLPWHWLRFHKWKSFSSKFLARNVWNWINIMANMGSTVFQVIFGQNSLIAILSIFQWNKLLFAQWIILSCISVKIGFAGKFSRKEMVQVG